MRDRSCFFSHLFENSNLVAKGLSRNIYLSLRFKNMNKALLLFFVFVLVVSILFVIPELSVAQPPPPPSKPDQTPIDGGLGLLAAAGGAYAIKKLRDKKK